MRQLTIMRQALADTIEAEGEDHLLEAICSRVAEGENPVAVAKSMGFSWFVLREWLEDGNRMGRLELAKRCFADGLIWKGLEIARDAQQETVAVDKFRAEYMQKSAGLMYPQGWGGKEEKNGGGITVVVNRGLEAKVECGVLTILPEQEKGYQERVISGEVI